MNLQEVFDQLTSGELSQLSIGGGEAGTVPESAYSAIARNVQLGLTSLYKRFNLKEKRSTATLILGQESYPMVMTDLLKIERVLTDAGLDLPLNDSANVDSCFTPNSSLLTVPAHIVAQANDLEDWLKTGSLTLVYRANHPKMDMAVAAVTPSAVELELPDAYLQALLLFVASRMHSPLGNTGNHHAGNNYFTRYLNECLSLETEGVPIDKTGQTNRLQNKGFV
jgi:hypothetical protein